jgi:hypothetical protein
MKPFRQHAEHADGASFAVPVGSMPCKQRHTSNHPGPPTSSPRHVFICHSPERRMQQEAITVTPEDATHLPLAFLRRHRTDVDTQHSKVPPFSLATERSVAYTSVRPAPLPANGVNYCVQSLATYRSLITASSTFDLFFKVLFTFRSHYFFAINLLVIFSFRRELPPTLV